MADITMADSYPPPAPGIEGQKFMVAVDFGTTFSSVCYIGPVKDSEREWMGLPQIDAVDRYPFYPRQNYTRDEVPSDICYLVNGRRTTVPAPQYTGTESSDDESSDEDQITSSGIANAYTASQRHDRLDAAPTTADTVRWGFGVQEYVRNVDSSLTGFKTLNCFKLLLDRSNNSAVEVLKDEIVGECKVLKEMGLIEQELDPIADYLDQLFRHTKNIMQRTTMYKDGDEIDFVLCVPAVWTSWACRQMQLAMEKAIGNSGLGHIRDKAVHNLFLVSEPEAAAACVLAAEETRVAIGESFVLLDAGGGTVDAITYEVIRDMPLRLKEVVIPSGELCGSSFINARFKKVLRKRLADQHYLKESGESIDKIIESLVMDFEIQDKRRMDQLAPGESFQLKVPGLRKDESRGFLDRNRMLWTDTDINSLWKMSRKGVARVMKYQIKEAIEEGHAVKKVILIGGFGQSRRLEAHLREVLWEDPASREVQLVVPGSQWSTTAVARGAMLRALQKKDGPERRLQSSYGFSRHEPFGDYPEHIGQVAKKDGVDKQMYIWETIEWFLQKGQTVPSEYVIPRKFEQTWGLRKKVLKIKESVFVSDENHPSHYSYKHPNNKGAEIAGTIELNVTELRDKGVIQLENADRPASFQYWKGYFNLNIIVNGRDLRYEITATRKDGAMAEQFVGARQICLAAAFRPGTE